MGEILSMSKYGKSKLGKFISTIRNTINVKVWQI